MQQLVFMVHILLCLALIALVLLQQGKGANMGPAFGSGASNTLFGSRGPASFLMKLTGGIAALFFVTSLGLSFLISQSLSHASDLTVTAPVSSNSMSATHPSQTESHSNNDAVGNTLSPVTVPVSVSNAGADASSSAAIPVLLKKK